jgi:hypothetical protein
LTDDKKQVKIRIYGKADKFSTLKGGARVFEKQEKRSSRF